MKKYFHEPFLPPRGMAQNMKKGFFIFVIFIISGAVQLSGCNSSDSATNTTIIGSDLIKYNMAGISDFGFNVNLISTKQNADVKFVDFFGENAQGMAVKLSDDSYDSLKNLKHKGYYIKILGFTCYTGDNYVRIDGVNLNIDGEDAKYTFATPIKHSIRQEVSSPLVQAGNYPLIISTNSYATTDYAFEYFAEADVTVTDFSFNDFLTMKERTYSIDSNEMGPFEEGNPIELNEGSVLVIKGKLGFSQEQSSSDYDSIYCDSQLTYTERDGTQSMMVRNNLVSQSVSNEADAEKVIDLLLGE